MLGTRFGTKRNLCYKPTQVIETYRQDSLHFVFTRFVSRGPNAAVAEKAPPSNEHSAKNASPSDEKPLEIAPSSDGQAINEDPPHETTETKSTDAGATNTSAGNVTGTSTTSSKQSSEKPKNPEPMEVTPSDSAPPTKYDCDHEAFL